jgi:hypothetical protein
LSEWSVSHDSEAFTQYEDEAKTRMLQAVSSDQPERTFTSIRSPTFQSEENGQYYAPKAQEKKRGRNHNRHESNSNIDGSSSNASNFSPYAHGFEQARKELYESSTKRGKRSRSLVTRGIDNLTVAGILKKTGQSTCSGLG